MAGTAARARVRVQAAAGRAHLLLPKSSEVTGAWRSRSAAQMALTPSLPSSLPLMCSPRQAPVFFASAFASTAAPSAPM